MARMTFSDVVAKVTGYRIMKEVDYRENFYKVLNEAHFAMVEASKKIDQLKKDNAALKTSLSIWERNSR